MFNVLKTRLNALIRLGIVTKVTSGKTQNLQLKTTANEILEDVKHIEPYGFTAHPPSESEAVVLNLNAFADNPIALVVGSRTFRIQDLKKGEVALYTDEGDSLIFKRGRTIEAKTTTFKINGDLNVSGNISSDGDISDNKGSMQGIRNTFNAHSHTGNLSAPTSKPFVEM